MSIWMSIVKMIVVCYSILIPVGGLMTTLGLPMWQYIIVTDLVWLAGLMGWQYLHMHEHDQELAISMA